MEPALEIEAEALSEVVVHAASGPLELRGEVRGPLAQTLYTQARRLERSADVMVRCERLTALDGPALQVLLALHQALDHQGHTLELRAVPPALLAELRRLGVQGALVCSSEPVREPLAPLVEEPERPADEALEAGEAVDMPTLPVTRGPDPVPVESESETGASTAGTNAVAETGVDAGWSLVPEQREPPEES